MFKIHEKVFYQRRVRTKLYVQWENSSHDSERCWKETLAYVKVLCLIDGKTDYAMVSAFLCDCFNIWNCECKTKLKTGDMVYVGMGTVINKTIDNTVRRWEEKFKTEEDFKGDKWRTNNTGTIIKKLKLTLNVATSQFDHED